MYIRTINDFDIYVYPKKDITKEIILFVKQASEEAFSSKRLNYNYSENYLWDPEDNKTLAYKFYKKQFDIICLVFQNGEFVSFSGMYFKNSQIAFGGVRRFSSKKSPLTPYHMAFVVPIQLEYARKLGARAFVLSYNVGIRDGFFKSISRIVNRKHSSGIYKEAQKMYLENSFMPREESTICNSTNQRLHYCILDNSLETCEFIRLVR